MIFHWMGTERAVANKYKLKKKEICFNINHKTYHNNTVQQVLTAF